MSNHRLMKLPRARTQKEKYKLKLNSKKAPRQLSLERKWEMTVVSGKDGQGVGEAEEIEGGTKRGRKGGKGGEGRARECREDGDR